MLIFGGTGQDNLGLMYLVSLSKFIVVFFSHTPALIFSLQFSGLYFVCLSVCSWELITKKASQRLVCIGIEQGDKLTQACCAAATGSHFTL